MKMHNEKNSVLQKLREVSVPMSLLELASQCGTVYAERSIRRWLSELVQAGLVERIGKKRATRYRAVQKSELPSKNGMQFGIASMSAIAYVHKPLYEREPITYKYEWLEQYVPNENFYLSADLQHQLMKVGSRSHSQDMAGTYAHHIFRRLLIDLSYNSSRLEGNTYSLLDTEKLIVSGTGAEGKLDEEKIMILNHKEAIRYLVDTAPKLVVNVETIYTLHYLLSDGLVEQKYSGKARDLFVRISGSAYIPLEGKERLQTILETIATKAAAIKNPYEKSFFLLVHISYLQAFIDVNKRTARLCANIALIYDNLVPLSFNDVEREDYMSALLAIYELQDIRPMVDLVLFSYMRTCVAYDAVVESVGFDEVHVRYRQQRRAIVREIIAQQLHQEKKLLYIETSAHKSVPPDVKAAVIEDILQDLEHLDHSRLIGLGVSVEQADRWLLDERAHAC